VTPDWTVRTEREGDAEAIGHVVGAAFGSGRGGEVSEPAIVAALRRDGALTISLVAEIDEVIIGHVAFSPVSISDGSPEWFGLGPVAVLPERQRRGVGSALIIAGLDALRAIGANGCTVLGDPHYYGRFGFSHDPGLTYPSPFPQAFQRQVFSGPEPNGEVTYHPAFG
jgi:putative acetyltransferase